MAYKPNGNPLSDVYFKKLFWSEDSTLLKSFLNNILQFEVKSIKILDPLIITETKRQELPNIDLLCKVNEDYYVIIETQVKTVSELFKLFHFYSSEVDESKINLSPLTVICLTNFEHSQNHLSYHKINNQNVSQNRLQNLEFIFLELNKFNKTVETISTELDTWIFFMKHASDINSEAAELLCKKNTVLEIAFKKLEHLKINTCEQLNICEQLNSCEIKAIEDFEDYIPAIDYVVAKAVNNEKKRIVKHMLEIGCNKKEIQDVINMTEEEIENILQEIKKISDLV